MKGFMKVKETICILINRQEKIYYSNIDKDMAEKYLEDIHVTKYVSADKTVSYSVKGSRITVDKVNLDKDEYYLILIESQNDLYKDAYKDSLTGLYNRNYWERLITSTVYHRLPKRYSLIIIDVDNLKSINDNKGHLEGDKVIKIVGQAIRESIRKQDIAVRYGGDEFFILISNSKSYVANKVVNRVRESINKKCLSNNIYIEISAGVACSNCSYDLKQMITKADDNLYKEKTKKKLQVE